MLILSDIASGAVSKLVYDAVSILHQWTLQSNVGEGTNLNRILAVQQLKKYSSFSSNKLLFPTSTCVVQQKTIFVTFDCTLSPKMCFYINNDLFWSIGSFVWFTEIICKQIKFEYSVKGAVGDLVKWTSHPPWNRRLKPRLLNAHSLRAEYQIQY